MKPNFWKNKKVLITGHTGFKGSWMTLMLKGLGAKVYGYALNPISKPNFFDGLKLKRFLEKDIRANLKDIKKFSKTLNSIKPQIVFHMAAQSSVLVSYKNPLDTIHSNVIGTVNVLQAIRECNSIKAVVIVTTDKVYLNTEQKKKFGEEDKLGGLDVYSGSKACCEILTTSYLNSFFKDKKFNLVTVRSGNCIGGGDWTKDRILKDCAESFIFNKKIVIRSPKASRPWQHVMEPIFGYLKLTEKLYFSKKYSGSWNFGPNLKNNIKVLDVAKFGKKLLRSKSKIILTKQKFHEANHLSLNSSKSLKYLNWKTRLKSKDALNLAFSWYEFYYQNRKKNINKIIDYTFSQINSYRKTFSKYL